jgi:hypothetical protein
METAAVELKHAVTNLNPARPVSGTDRVAL